jgi:hypothetical protein
MGPLRSFYEALLKPDAVKPFGRAFAFRSNPWEINWLGEHGWSYTVICSGHSRSANIPVLFHVYYTFSDFVCTGPTEHVWRATWRGARTDMRLWFSGSASVQTDGNLVTSEPGKPSLDFKVEPGAQITVRVAGPVQVLAALYVVTPRQERLPYWEWLDPIEPPGGGR